MNQYVNPRSAERLSASQIAAQLGVTRNAVIGKLGRPAPKPKRERVHVAAFLLRRPAYATPPPLPAMDSGNGAVTLMELSNKNCHWPMDANFCGAAAVDGKPYCGHHSRVAYRKAGEHR